MNISIGKTISSIYRMQSVMINDICKDLHIGSSQYLYLLKIAEHPGITQKALSDLILIDRANVNRALKKLEELGYITIRSDEHDARNKRSELTDEGKDVTATLRKRLLSVTSVLKQDINEEALDVFLEVLHQMESNIQEVIKTIKEQNG